ncbi:MAG: bifunctional (p)ppGpp synthetase/guanosine-3',5'-bis(diphosphate) 3'-pyrophosphohydrolase [Nitrospinae bacterium]|nr:bifunctional (p)ppGpp synthetase/guanosine-3',5'-bis(diphosphate) 3'-pyrophosphohydrolase [Nitrospinota bacterium]MZH04815.1 bifunctional (p)ppGpp synthetase/guanosine-3',5'-bis(diphosphate) 3'-pyrophosphohydrolase [Nitrospinota bacterium]MZH13227.1 bifunctional (p)ppGpp synthetase/guanosine-3',5'-bis(diphosphate) 3'-pyrophosphohydrolase [Nitrospinota bacterium]
MMKIEDLIESLSKYLPEADIGLVQRAYEYSAKAHQGQSRRSGEAYISHPLEVANNLVKLKMDETTLAAGLLHDTIEDTLSTPEEIQELFGEEIFQLVDGVTKISKMNFSSHEENQAENYRKMIFAMAKDIRVVLIKLADRAHNVQTLDSLSEERQRRIARETIDIYAPIANRLGIGWLKTELENGSFRYLFPEEYSVIKEKVARGQEYRDKYVEKSIQRLEKELKAVQIKGKVTGRPKNYYSIYKKMMDQNISFEDVYDLVGLRVLTDSLQNCYSVLGLVHSLWKPIPGKFKDYIAMPKPNRYQSLHTTVIGPRGERVEVQIRSDEMHKVCEEGIAAHWRYKESEGQDEKIINNQLLWVRHLLENQKDLMNPKEFLNAFKVNLFPHEVFVFTPEGEVIALPYNATPVDFAFQVHTDVGCHCQSAKVNGKTVPLRYKLRNGDQVEITTAEDAAPSRDWLAFVKTSKARNRISSFVNNEERSRSLEFGKELLEKEIREYGFDPFETLNAEGLEEAAHACGFKSTESMFAGIGIGKLSTYHVLEKLLPKEKLEGKKPKEETLVKLKENKSENAIKVQCLNDNIMIRIGKCCHPLPGEPIVGYMTRGRGVTVHHIDCPSVNRVIDDSERLVGVEWDTGNKTIYQAHIAIVAADNPGIFASIGNAFAEGGINLTRANVQQGAHKRAYFDLSIEIHDVEHLNQTLEKIRQVEGVIYLERMKEFNKNSPLKNRLEAMGGNLDLKGKKKLTV